MPYSALHASIVGRVGCSALANERVQLAAAGRVVLKLKTPWRDGTTHLSAFNFCGKSAP